MEGFYGDLLDLKCTDKDYCVLDQKKYGYCGYGKSSKYLIRFKSGKKKVVRKWQHCLTYKSEDGFCSEHSFDISYDDSEDAEESDDEDKLPSNAELSEEYTLEKVVDKGPCQHCGYGKSTLYIVKTEDEERKYYRKWESCMTYESSEGWISEGSQRSYTKGYFYISSDES
jgi:ribosomal protein L37E